MIRAAVIEPSKERREFLEAAVAGGDFDTNTITFRNEYDFLESLDDTSSGYDMVLLNTTIHSEGDGVALAGQIRKKNQNVMIAFVTDSDGYYAQAFDLFATGYLLYPVDVSKLLNCIGFYYHKSTIERRASVMIKEKGERYRRIYCRHIMFIESNNREITIHMEDGSEICTYMKLDKIETDINSNLFLRCHQSFIVNLYFVDELSAAKFSVEGNEIPISRKYQKISKDRYYDYMFEHI